MTKVKICGVTRQDDVVAAVGAGADMIGINLWPFSKRCVCVDDARNLAKAARDVSPSVDIVGVFVNQEAAEIADLADVIGLDYVQLHGDESPEFCAGLETPVMKAIAVASSADIVRLAAYPVAAIVLDTPSPCYGGSGMTFDWSLAVAATRGPLPIVLAGGLTPENVAAAVAEVAPFAVDVASGVESAPGIKGVELMRRFIAAAKGEE
jgi:phosphoribosylanthranilate isomerase